VLYFTRTDPKTRAIEALYSGRFAFIASMSASDAESLMAMRKLRGGLASSREIRSLVTSFEEEFEHQRQALTCKSGLVLSGLRMWARLLWTSRRSERWVRLYYRLRTQFYLQMYDLMEQAVAPRQPQEGRGTRQSLIDPRDRVRHADRKLLSSWKANLSGWDRFAVTMSSPFLSVLGWMMARHFTVVTVEWRENQLVETNVAASGIVNVAGSYGLQSPRLHQRIVSLFRIERHWPNSPAADWSWLLLKFETERQTMKSFGKKGSWTFVDYVERVMSFVERWVCLDDPLRAMSIARLVTTVPYSQQIAHSLPKEWAEDPRTHKLVNFFYIHGN